MNCDGDMSKFVPARSICGECARATALEGRLGCEWIRDGRMVYGVRYQKRVSRSSGKWKKSIWLYIIVDCPEYIAEGANASLKRAQRRARLDQTINEKNYGNLAGALAKNVVDDYRRALKSGNAGRIVHLERELRSEHFHMVSGLDGDAVIRRVRKEVEEGER